jgi:hypothetical protein
MTARLLASARRVVAVSNPLASLDRAIEIGGRFVYEDGDIRASHVPAFTCDIQNPRFAG